MWNPFESIKKAITGEPSAPAADGSAAAPSKAEQAALEKALQSEGGLKELEKKGMLGQFFRHWKNPAFLKQLRVIVGRMQADGVNVKDRKAVEAWLTIHQKEIESGTLADTAAAAKPQTFVKTGPEIGRNDPCTCGSGKKYKKCCGQAA